LSRRARSGQFRAYRRRVRGAVHRTRLGDPRQPVYRGQVMRAADHGSGGRVDSVVTGPPPVAPRRAARWIGVSLTSAMLAGVAVLVVYALGGQHQVEGVLLFVLLAGIGFALIFWGK